MRLPFFFRSHEKIDFEASLETTTFLYDASGIRNTRQLDNGTWTSLTYGNGGTLKNVAHLNPTNQTLLSLNNDGSSNVAMPGTVAVDATAKTTSAVPTPARL